MVDVLVGSTLVLIIFLALIGLLRSSLLIASVAKARAGATAVGNTHMEYVRSLSYDSVGTVGGIPAGVVPQYATTTMNGITYSVRTFIGYVDDPADGSDAADTNGITTDYKRIKVEVTYELRGKYYELPFVSTYAPASIETTTGGGTLKIVVVNATGDPVAGASVQVVNASTSPTIDVTTFSDVTGTVYLGGAATSTQYQIYVSKDGYSSAQTYARDAVNQNPTPGYFTVVENTTTTATFAIDTLATLTLATYYPIRATSTTDTFADSSQLASLTNATVSGGRLQLGSDAGGYLANGSARSTAVAPALLAYWTTASTTLLTPSNTTVRVQVADAAGTILPDADVPGNSAGFTSTSIDLSTVSTSTYPSLSLVATMSTTDASSTPSVDTWSLNSRVGPVPEPNVPFTLSGTKVIGSTGGGAPILKTTLSTSTNASGIAPLSLEWDSYTFSITGYDVVEACAAPPYALSPGSTNSAALYLGDATTHRALVWVRDTTGASVSGATVTLTDSSSGSEIVTTSTCGTAYFGGLASGTYTITIAKTGYTTTNYTDVTISGHLFYAASFP